MTPEQLTRQLPPRPGYRLADYVEVGLPVYRITARLFTQVQKRIGTIDEFLLRLVCSGVQRTPELAEFLGLDKAFVDDSLSQLLNDELLTLQGDSDRRQRLMPTAKGVKALEEAETVIVEEKTHVVDYDALLRTIVQMGREQLLSGFQMRREGRKQIRPLLKRTIDINDLSLPGLQKTISAVRLEREQRRFVLAVRELYRKKLYFMPAVAVVYRSLDRADIQVAFIVNGKHSPLHDDAFAKLDGVRLLGIDSDLSRNREIEFAEIFKEAEEMRASLAGSAVSPLTLSGAPQPIGDEREPDFFEHLSNEQKYDLEQNYVTALFVQDHPSLLQFALRSAKHRLLIICPFLTESVCSSQFEQRLEQLLRAGVRVYIGYGMPDSDQQKPSKTHLNVINKIDSIAKRNRLLKIAKTNSHAKLLLVDSLFFVIGSFNWLSFHGDPDRPFRDEQSVLVSIPNMIERKFQELAGLF